MTEKSHGSLMNRWMAKKGNIVSICLKRCRVVLSHTPIAFWVVFLPNCDPIRRTVIQPELGIQNQDCTRLCAALLLHHRYRCSTLHFCSGVNTGAGLHLGTSTIDGIRKENPVPVRNPQEAITAKNLTVAARRPNHVAIFRHSYCRGRIVSVTSER